MPGLDGFEALARVVEHYVPVVVFVTAYDQYAVRAFEAQAVDYLLKPFDDERFAEALRRAKKAVEGRDLEGRAERLLALLDGPRSAGADSAGPAAPAASRYPARLMVRSGPRLLFVRPEQIDWIEAEDYYSRVHVSGASYLLRASLAELEGRLDPAEFARVHRSAIVNLDRVREIHPDAKGQEVVRLEDGTLVPISRGRRAALERAFRAG
jgi:two-component system LytT family response regulator